MGSEWYLYPLNLVVTIYDCLSDRVKLRKCSNSWNRVKLKSSMVLLTVRSAWKKIGLWVSLLSYTRRFNQCNEERRFFL